jgi:dihydrofolate synthase/folylpolyglutamate synthase
MRALAAALGNPQNAFRSVLIAGTNGKGSVAKLLSSMMPEAGLYTSPHLIRLNERISIGGREIPDEDLKNVFDTVNHAATAAKDLLYPPTYFEIVTAMAFEYFRDLVDFAVLEVGLGGRLDATNEAIAAEKAGIIKQNEPVVIGPSADLPPIREKAGTRLLRASKNDLSRYPDLRPQLLGRHQLENIAVAIRAAECLGLSRENIVRGVNMATWPGRLERIGRFLLDGAHNVPAAHALADFLEETYPQGVWIIFGAMADKEYEAMLAILRPHARQFVFTKPQSSRAKEPVELQKLVPDAHVELTVPSAISYARQNAPDGTIILICGSLYLIGEARSALLA